MVLKIACIAYVQHQHHLICLQTSRFRNRKINFKIKLPIHTGSFDIIYDEQSDVAIPTGTDSRGSTQERPGVETGVDKDEEGEVHLQNAISASAAALLARNSANRAATAATSKASAGPYIPTPDATGAVPDYANLYSQRAFLEPSTLIRFSDTVEDVVGLAYTLDEEDLLFLQGYNSRVANERDATTNGISPNAALNERHLRSPRKEKGKESAHSSSFLSDDDFELVMDHFERYTEERVPILHADLNRIPALADLEASLASSDSPYAAAFRQFARFVYPYWKERRLRRGGRSIIPQLDYDESHEDNPYVCFRRREVKVARKTRRSETHNIERLHRLRSDLSTARDLLQLVFDREKVKREMLREEARIFEQRTRFRELKRRAQENDGDDELLVPKERRKRRRAEDASPSAIMSSAFAASIPSFKTTIRLPGRDIAGNVVIPAPPLYTEPLNAFRDRTQVVANRIDRDMERKRAADREWEDYTDGAYCPPPFPLPIRFFRAPDVPFERSPCAATPVTFAGAQQITHALGGVRPAYRKRIGRTGRIFIDRVKIGRTSADSSCIDAVVQERWRYDTDGVDEAVSEQPIIVDDFALPNILRRLDLLRRGDIFSLTPAHTWLDQAAAYLSKEPDVVPAYQAVGKLPGRQVIISTPAPTMSTMLAMQTASNHANPMPSLNTATSNPMVNQMLLAATQAHQVAQNQLAQAGQNHMRRTSNNGGPLSPQVPLNNPAAATFLRRSNSVAPVANGVTQSAGNTLAASLSSALPHPFAKGHDNNSVATSLTPASVHSAALQQSSAAGMPNGTNRAVNLLSTATAVGANGILATSRLSAPPCSNDATISSPLASPNAAVQRPADAQMSPQPTGAAFGSSPALRSDLVPASGSMPPLSYATQLPSAPAVSPRRHSSNLQLGSRLPLSAVQ